MSLYDDLAVIILAAGKGTRMKSEIAKVLHKVAGKTMIIHVVECALKITDNNIHVVVGHQAEKVQEEVSKYFKVDYAVQKELLGTGDAVKAALPGMKSGIKNVLVLCGDVPLIQEDTLRNLVDGHNESGSKITVLATDIEDSKGYGRIIFDKDKNLLCIREEADANENEKKIKKINAGIYCFDKQALISAINHIKPDNNQSEYYLTDVVEIARSRHQKIVAVTMNDPKQVIGVNTLEDLGKAECLIQQFGK